MMTYEERCTIQEVMYMLRAIRMEKAKTAADYPFSFGYAQATTKLALDKLEALLGDPEDLPSAAYDANDSQEMGRL